MSLFLVTPSAVPMDEIDEFRKEFFDSGLKIQGCDGLSYATSAYDWLLHGLWVSRGQNIQMFSYSTELQQYVGCIRLTPFVPSHMVANLALNVGQSIRPSLWNRGLGTQQLREGLKMLKDLGLQECLMSVKSGSASERVVEKCGGTILFESGEDRVYQILLTK